MRKPFAVLLALLTTAAVADDGVKTQQVIVQPLDTMQSCYLKNDVYSSGMRVVTDAGTFECRRVNNPNGSDEEMPLEWVKLDTY